MVHGPALMIPGLLVAFSLASCGGQSAPSVATNHPLTPGSNGTSAQSPGGTAGGAATASDTVRAYFSDLAAKDCRGAFGLLVDPLRAQVASAASLCGDGSGGDNASFTVGQERLVSDGRATVHTRVVKVNGEVHEDDLAVIQTSQGWRISEVQIGSATPSPGVGSGAPAGQLSAEAVVATIEQQYSQQLGGTGVTLTCPRTGSFASVPGDRFVCSFTDQRGRAGRITVSVNSTGGAFTWAIGGSAPVASPTSG